MWVKFKKRPLFPPASEEDILKGNQSIRGQALGNQSSESEALLDGDDDTLSSLEEKELENLTGKASPPLRAPHSCFLSDSLSPCASLFVLRLTLNKALNVLSSPYSLMFPSLYSTVSLC